MSFSRFSKFLGIVLSSSWFLASSFVSCMETKESDLQQLNKSLKELHVASSKVNFDMRKNISELTRIGHGIDNPAQNNVEMVPACLRLNGRILVDQLVSNNINDLMSKKIIGNFSINEFLKLPTQEQEEIINNLSKEEEYFVFSNILKADSAVGQLANFMKSVNKHK